MGSPGPSFSSGDSPHRAVGQFQEVVGAAVEEGLGGVGEESLVVASGLVTFAVGQAQADLDRAEVGVFEFHGGLAPPRSEPVKQRFAVGGLVGALVEHLQPQHAEVIGDQRRHLVERPVLAGLRLLLAHRRLSLEDDSEAELPQEVVGLAGRLAAAEPLRREDAVLQVMATTADDRALRTLAEGLTAVAARMGPQEAAAACARGADILLQAMKRTTAQPDEYTLWSFAELLSKLLRSGLTRP
jgi:hypothetical protein